MTVATVNHKKPILRLRLGIASASPGSSSPPPDPVLVPSRPPPPPKPIPAAEPIAAKDVQVTLAILAERFPKCFKLQGARLPLKIGVAEDVINLAPDLNGADVKQAIKVYVSDAAYHQAMIKGATRVDLDGTGAGVVTREQAGFAQFKLRKRKISAITRY